jgi:hypothetical protein
MIDAVLVDRHRSRGPWTPPKPDGPPSCPGCGRELELMQPDPGRPDDFLGVCGHHPCGEWIVLRRREGRWIVAERIPRVRERIRGGRAARPAAIAAAAG